MPVDRYSINAPAGTFVPLPEKLAEVHKKVEGGLFDAKKAPRISYSKVHQGQIHANSSVQKARDVAARRGSAWPIVDAGGTNSTSTVGVHAMVTAENEARYVVKKLGGIDGEEVRIVCRD